SPSACGYTSSSTRGRATRERKTPYGVNCAWCWLSCQQSPYGPPWPLTYRTRHLLMQCAAHKRDGSGQPCRKPAMKGATVCASHGGSAPQVRAAAQRRLLEAADPVAARLVHLALNSDDEKVQLAACRDLLDRVAVTS